MKTICKMMIRIPDQGCQTMLTHSCSEIWIAERKPKNQAYFLKLTQFWICAQEYSMGTRVDPSRTISWKLDDAFSSSWVRGNVKWAQTLKKGLAASLFDLKLWKQPFVVQSMWEIVLDIGLFLWFDQFEIIKMISPAFKGVTGQKNCFIGKYSFFHFFWNPTFFSNFFF